MSETQVQYTERMREKYAAALELLEQYGPNEFQKNFDKALSKFLGEIPKKEEEPKLEKLSDILKRYG